MSEYISEYIMREITPDDNPAVAHLIRSNLKNHGLDIPGTVYFDPIVDKLCEFYCGYEGRGYYVMTDENGKVVGAIGFAEFPTFVGCAELQKLYLADSVKGRGLGYELIKFVEKKMREKGYKSSYLETHYNLQAAIHIYEKSGYSKIERPKDVAHGAMTEFYFKNL